MTAEQHRHKRLAIIPVKLQAMLDIANGRRTKRLCTLIHVAQAVQICLRDGIGGTNGGAPEKYGPTTSGYFYRNVTTRVAVVRFSDGCIFIDIGVGPACPTMGFAAHGPKMWNVKGRINCMRWAERNGCNPKYLVLQPWELAALTPYGLCIPPEMTIPRPLIQIHRVSKEIQAALDAEKPPLLGWPY